MTGLIFIESEYVLTKEKENELYDKTIFVLHELFKDCISKLDNIQLTIELVKDLKIIENIYGDIINLDDDEFYIRLDDGKELITTLCHELTHVYQYMHNLHNTQDSSKFEKYAYDKEIQLMKQLTENYYENM